MRNLSKTLKRKGQGAVQHKGSKMGITAATIVLGTPKKGAKIDEMVEKERKSVKGGQKGLKHT